MNEIANSKISIRLELEGKEAERFLKIKENRGLKSNADVIRQLVLEAFKKEDGGCQ